MVNTIDASISKFETIRKQQNKIFKKARKDSKTSLPPNKSAGVNAATKRNCSKAVDVSNKEKMAVANSLLSC